MFWSPYRPMSAEVLRTLLQAVMDRKVVTITYRTPDGITERDIQPIGLYAGSGYWYCPAYCFMRGALRQFRADRIVSAVINEARPGRADIDELTIHDRSEPGSREAYQAETEREAADTRIAGPAEAVEAVKRRIRAVSGLYE